MDEKMKVVDEAARQAGGAMAVALRKGNESRAEVDQLCLIHRHEKRLYLKIRKFLLG